LTQTKDQNAPNGSLIQNDSKTPRLGPIIDCHVDKRIRTRNLDNKKTKNKE